MSPAAAPASAAKPEKSSSFYLGFLFLPKAKREALSAVYAYCRLIDDIVDSGTIARDEARRMLGFWREEIERLYQGAPTHAASRALLPHVAAFGLPKQAFLEIIRGCAMDLDRSRYETFAELEPYLAGVASAAGTLSVAIFGARHTSPQELADFAQYFGYAFQLTNILRDVGADWESGRVYLPLEDMRECGYSCEALARRETGPAFSRLMNKEYQRAKYFYMKGRAALDPRDRRAMLPAEIMAHIYEGLLERIRAEGYPVLSRRVRLSAWGKIRRAAAAWRYGHGR